MAELTEATLAWLAELNATIRADERAKVAEEIAKAIEADCRARHNRPDGDPCVDEDCDRHTAIARQHAAHTCTHQPHEVTSLSKPHREFLCGRCGHAWTEPWNKDPSHGNSAHIPGEQQRDVTNKAPRSPVETAEPARSSEASTSTPKPAETN